MEIQDMMVKINVKFNGHLRLKKTYDQMIRNDKHEAAPPVDSAL